MGNVDQKVSQALATAAKRREAIRPELHRFYLPFYDALCLRLRGTFWIPTSGLRSPSQQQKLYDQGRSEESKKRGERIVTNAHPGDSAHNWGCASDWVCLDPSFPPTKIYDLSDWKIYVGAVEEVGLTWGGDWNGNKKKDSNDFDKPHNELSLTVPYTMVGGILRAKGREAALDFLQSKIKGGSRK